MKPAYQNQPAQRVRKNEKQFLSVAPDCSEKRTKALGVIRDSMAPAKVWASALSVGERIVQMWLSGEREIPYTRIDDVFEAAGEILCEQRDAINRTIDECMFRQFGGRK